MVTTVIKILIAAFVIVILISACASLAGDPVTATEIQSAVVQNGLH